MRQLRTFAAAIGRREREQRISDAMMFRLVRTADRKVWKQYMKTLKD